MSDEVSGSLSDNFRRPVRWASRVNSSDFGGSRSQTFHSPPPSNEKQDLYGASRAAPMNLSSSVSISESSTSKKPFGPGRRSYPLVFCNPVSDLENPKSTDTKEDPSLKPKPAGITRKLSPSLFRSHNSIDEPSPDLSTSSRSEEEMELDFVERLDETETMVRTPGHSLGSMRQHQKCGVCGKLLSQKSPWCSYKLMRSSDMPAAGVLPCCHVYHVECLDQVTPKAQTRDPPCPVCSKAFGAIEESLTVSEPLHLALRSLRSRRVTQETPESAVNPENGDSRSHTGNQSWRWIRIRCCLNIISSSSPQHQHELTEH